MVSQVQLGNFFSSGGKTVLGGVGGSGLDTEALVKALGDAKRLPAVQMEDKIKLNDKKSTALSEFQTLLSKFKDATNFLRNPPGVGNASEDIFKFTNGSVSASGGNTASNYLSVTAAPGAALQSYSITEITSIAKAKKQATDNIAIADATAASAVSATPGADQFKAGTFTLNGQSITFDAGDTLNEVAAKLNAVDDLTGIHASVIKVSTGNYRLSFSATATGEDADFDFNDIGTLDDATGVFDNFVITETQGAANAEFIIDGVTVTRQSNSVDDVIDGITFNLLQATPDELALDAIELTVDIEPDEDIVHNGIINFINTYNDLKIFAAKQTEVGADGRFTEDAVLANSSSFRTTMSAVNAQLTSIVGGITDGDPSRLADIGITFVDLPKSDDNPLTRNILNVDDGILTSAISSNFEGVRRVFEFDMISENPNLQVFRRTNALGVSNITLNIDPGTDTFEATYDIGDGPVTIDLDFEAITGGNGYVLTGQDGTVLQGLQLLYSSTGASNFDVTMTQGIADKLFNVTDGVLTQHTGTLAVELDSLATSDEKLTEEITRIDEQVERFRQQLLEKFAALEQAIARVNTLLQSLNAQDQARNAANG